MANLLNSNKTTVSLNNLNVPNEVFKSLYSTIEGKYSALEPLVQYIPKVNKALEPLIRLMENNNNSKNTSSRVATEASEILRSGRYSKISKSVAGSALTQANNNYSNKKK